jgi:hypothetical protein
MEWTIYVAIVQLNYCCYAMALNLDGLANRQLWRIFSMSHSKSPTNARPLRLQ